MRRLSPFARTPVAVALCTLACSSEQSGETNPKGDGAPASPTKDDSESTPPRDDTPTTLPEPRNVFTLPAANDKRELYYPELQTAFPDVDFATLDRLYIPAGEYRSVLLGGLPDRDAKRPLVITNQGGQVKVGGDAANYVFVIHGGKNWILTGRYDAKAATGDASFVGHAAGKFAGSSGTYGISIDDAFSKEGLTGLSVGDGASDFEIEMLEIARAEFAGIVAKTDDDGSAIMRNVRLHDTYVHDTGSEGIYFGSTQAQPQHPFENLQIYDNRFIRTGTEALQVGQLGDGCEIHHNLLGPAALRWRSAFQAYQDGNVQYGQRYGSSSFHHNLVIGTGDLFVEMFPQPVAGDPHGNADTVTFADNYFSDTSSSGVYTHAEENSVTIRFERNAFRGFHFNYAEVYPDASQPIQVFGIGSNTLNPHLLTDNQFDAAVPFVKWTFDSVTQERNTMTKLDPVEFRDFMTPEIEANFRTLEWWTDKATLSPDQRIVEYTKGAYVMHGGTLYRALMDNSGAPPDTSPDAWEALPPPNDDARPVSGSAYAALGVRTP